MQSRYWTLIISIAAFSVSTLVHASPLTIVKLMNVLAVSQQGNATFTETKYLSILDQPFESSGELLFSAPAYLEKRTLKPWPETEILDGETLTIRKNRRKLVLQLKQHPQVAAMIEGVRATLVGDLNALERVYRLRLNGTLDSWHLLLTPRSADVSAVVSHVEFRGHRNLVSMVEIDQADGDRTVMYIKPVTTRAEAP